MEQKKVYRQQDVRIEIAHPNAVLLKEEERLEISTIKGKLKVIRENGDVIFEMGKDFKKGELAEEYRLRSLRLTLMRFIPLKRKHQKDFHKK